MDGMIKSDVGDNSTPLVRCDQMRTLLVPVVPEVRSIDSARANRLIEQRRSVLFVPTFKLVQDLLAAKRDLDLPRALRKLDHFEVLILD